MSKLNQKIVLEWLESKMRLVETEDAAEELGVHPDTVRPHLARLAKTGKAVRLGVPGAPAAWVADKHKHLVHIADGEIDPLPVIQRIVPASNAPRIEISGPRWVFDLAEAA